MVAEMSASGTAEQQLRRAFLHLCGSANALASAADTAQDNATQGHTVAERDAARATHRAETRAEAEASEALDNIRTVLLGRAERLAPGLASAPWDAPQWRGGEWLGTGSRFLRLGTVNVDGLDAGEDLPALVPLLDAGSITFMPEQVAAGENADASWLITSMQALLLRTFATTPPGLLEVVVFDPKLRGALSPFSALRRSGIELLGEPLATAADLLDKLQQARDAALRVAELAGAHQAQDLSELRALTGIQPEPYRLFVLLDYPYGIDHRVQTELVRLADAGPQRGVSLLVAHDPAAISSHSYDAPIDVTPLLAHTTVVRGRPGAVRIDALPQIEVSPDPLPQRELIDVVSSQVAQAALKGAAPTVGFHDLLPPNDLLWSADATHGLEAPIGKSGLDVVTLELRGADPALPNALIGGASGQGKSNLLLVMLHSIAANYSPREVEMYLLDYKDGLEFDRLGPGVQRPHWMPHAKVLGLEGDRLFGLAVLRHIDAEFRRRAERFRTGGCNSIAAYRQAYPHDHVPRLLLVIDEFQVLVAEGDEIGREAIAILETLARRGRAVGVHLVLASQTLSGIDTLASKERSIFGQFPWRISLKTEASESEAVLGRGNTEAAQLRYRGEVVLNSEYGSLDHNHRAVVAYADERQLDRLREQLWERAVDHNSTPPRVFYASRPCEPAELPLALERLRDDPSAVLLGLPVRVDPAPVTFTLDSDPGRTLAILGDGRDDALGVLSNAALSLSAAAPAHSESSAEFVILDGIGTPETPTPELVALSSMLGDAGHKVTVRPVTQIGDAFLQLGQLVDARLGDPDSGRPSAANQRPVYVIAAGMHRAARLSQMTMSGLSPAECLQRVVRDGPLADVYLLSWWNTLRVFTEHLGYNAAPLVGGLLFLRAPESDVQAMCGPYVRYQAKPHRALFVDRTRGSEPAPVVPFRCVSVDEAKGMVER